MKTADQKKLDNFKRIIYWPYVIRSKCLNNLKKRVNFKNQISNRDLLLFKKDQYLR